MSDRHLILGGCGFIGRHLALRLARAGHAVILADRIPPSWTSPPDIAGRIAFERFDFASADWDRLVADAECIHHCVWTSLPASANANPLGDLTLNVTATLALLEAMRRRPGRRLIFASSGGTVYGRLRVTPAPETHDFHPVTAYGAGKATAELYLGLYRDQHGVDARVARVANAYGAGQDPRREQGAISIFIRRALAGRPITLWGDGEVVRDYVHVEDVAEALARLATVPDAGPEATVNIGSGVGASLNAVLEEIGRQLGRRLDVRRERPRGFDVPVSVLDIARAGALLGWAPRIGLNEGIARTIAELRGEAPPPGDYQALGPHAATGMRAGAGATRPSAPA